MPYWSVPERLFEEPEEFVENIGPGTLSADEQNRENQPDQTMPHG